MTDKKSANKPEDTKRQEAPLEDLPAEHAKEDDAPVKGGQKAWLCSN